MLRRGVVRAIAATLAAVAIAGSASAAAPTDGSARVYKWVDSKGVIHYGDSVPAEYAQGDRSILNSQGVEIDHVAGRKNAEEQKLQDQADQSARDRKLHDQFLLTTYTSTKDIEQLRDERVGQIDGQIKASLVYIESLRVRLTELVQRAQVFKPYSDDPKARRLPDQLAAELVRTSDEARTQRLALDVKRKEESDVRAQFEADVVRYKELTTRPNP